MASQPPLSDQEQADLVSYLDGELDAPNVRDLEARLARDPRVRSEADALRRTWELLDYLPRPEPSPDFTHRTLENVSAVHISGQGPGFGGSRHWRKGILWVAAVLVAWLAGFAAVLGYARWAHPHERIDPRLVADLRVIDNLRGYQTVEDLQFLRALDTSDLFGDATSGSAVPAGPPRSASADAPASQEEEQNRRLLERWRTDPEHYARLRQDLDVFQALPEGQQDRLRKLDRSLHEVDAATQRRLQGVLERFLSWLDHLSDEDRARVRDAGGTFDRLVAIRKVRDQEWIAQQPRARREKITAARDPADRAKLIARYREEEQLFRQQWARLQPRGPNDPPRGKLLLLADFPQEVQDFVTRSLRPLLTTEEKVRLDDAEGQGPLFARTLLDLTEEHAFALPGSALRPTRPPELPVVLRQLVQRDKDEPGEGKKAWAARFRNPEFAIAVIELAKKHRTPAPQLAGTPCRPADFDSSVRELLNQRFLPSLTKPERDRLRSLEGQWPDFPRELVDLLRKKQVRVPGVNLPPGSAAFWDRAAATLPEIPRPALNDFAAQHLTREEGEQLDKTLREPESREALYEMYYRRNPQRLREQLMADYELAQKKSGG